MKYTFIISLIFSIFILYYLIHKYLHKLKEQKNNPIFLWKAKSCQRPEIIDSEEFPESTTSNGYSISFWLWISQNARMPLTGSTTSTTTTCAATSSTTTAPTSTDNNFRSKDKKWLHILHKGDPLANYCQPGIWIHPEKNDLYTFVDLKRSPSNYKPLEPNKFLKKGGYDEKLEDKTLGEIKKKCNDQTDCTAISYICKDSRNPCSICRYAWLSKSNNYTLINTPPMIDISPIDIKKSTTEFADPNKARLMDLANSGYSYQGTIIKQKNKPSMNPNINKNLIYQKHTVNNIENIPIGRWFQFAIVVDSHSTIIYIDGLVASIITIPNDNIKMNKNNLYINTLNEGFPGLISQIKYFSHPISQHKIASIYQWGPNPWKLPDITNFNLRCKKYLFKGRYVDVINGKKIFNLLGFGKKQVFSL